MRCKYKPHWLLSALIILTQRVSSEDIDLKKSSTLKRVSIRQTSDEFHPLDPLTEAEVNYVTLIIKNFRNDTWQFNYIALKEPAKSVFLPFFLQNTDPYPITDIPRKAVAVLLNRKSNEINEVTVNLDDGKIEEWIQSPTNVSPSITGEEILEAERIAREDASVMERCRLLGWQNMSLVNGDAWSLGNIDKPEYIGKRLVQLYMFGKNYENDNYYTHPFDFMVIVDLLQSKVIAIEDLPTHEGLDASNKKDNVVPTAESNYSPSLRDPSTYRQDLNRVDVVQKDGPSYIVIGNEIKWQKFKFRVGFNGREGLVIYHVNYNDGGRVRPLFYRMSLAEMFVPYADPRPPYHRNHFLHISQHGLGVSANELLPQVDCLGEVHMIDVVLHNDNGEAQPRSRIICIYEEDAGILWKHTQYRNGATTTVRSQRLGVTFTATVGNYDYIFTWFFYQDGTIEFNVKLTGILRVHLVARNSTPAGFGSVVFPQINAPLHQHFFCLRLDAEIDGNQNTVSMVEVVPVEDLSGSGSNPYGQGFTTRSIPLRTTGTSRTNTNPQTSRTWSIENPSSINPYTSEPVAWKLTPFPSPTLMVRRDSPIHPTAKWADFNTCVTPYAEAKFFPGGYHLNGSNALPELVDMENNENIENTDIVLWHTFGLTHIPRTEEFPILSVETCGITLKPRNFFYESPALDVPQSTLFAGSPDAVPLPPSSIPEFD